MARTALPRFYSHTFQVSAILRELVAQESIHTVHPSLRLHVVSHSRAVAVFKMAVSYMRSSLRSSAPTAYIKL